MVGLEMTIQGFEQTSFSDSNCIRFKSEFIFTNFTGTVSGIDKTMVGLGNVDNT
jgi:hypothetical protein